MAVAVDVAGTPLDIGTSSTPANYTGLTIGSISASNPALLALVTIKAQATVWSTTSPTLLWDATGTSQSMSLIGRAQSTTAGNGFTIELWGLVNPHTGLKTLRYAWTGGVTPNMMVNAISLTNVLQTSNALAFPTARFNSATSASSAGPATVAITSATGNMAFAAFMDNIFDNDPITSPAGATEWTSSNPNNFNEAYHAAGAATVTFTSASFGGAQEWIVAGCDVVAAAGATEGYSTQIFRPKRSLWR